MKHASGISYREVSDIVRVTRANRRLTLRDAAEQIGISWPTLYRVEKALHEPSPTVLANLAIWLGRPIFFPAEP